ncbi:MAG TPA: glutamine-hydrolyzing carbamoyl-phosphate synthase small subunit [Thermodesulfobacteriota bacterium]|nr:glutamine-hydrolyzing carbamoyl-phosphate synthase small subunit [Thermodesulfobacteriota bacterium]
MREALLVLEDGTVFEGRGFGAEGEVYGEVVFNTSITGYQEILTDPSYNGQIVIMTYPEIGNYGINPEDVESRRPFVRGFVVGEYWESPSNWRSCENLGGYLSRYGVVGIEGIDTRELTKRIRTHGAQRGVISTVDLDGESLLRKVRLSPSIVGVDLVTEVSCSEPYIWNGGSGPWRPIYDRRRESERSLRVVAYDFGIKRNILRRLVDTGCEVWVVPSRTPPHEVLSMNPDGIVLSNGPGDPAAVSYAIESVRALIGKKPIFGICLGHQIIGWALGGRTYKLKFGHRGANQPVKNLLTGRVEITSQNHGFAVDPDSLGSGVEITHVNLNDNTVEGLRHREYPLFSVQYHPEASPGPHDSSYLFHEFLRLMEEWGS